MIRFVELFLIPAAYACVFVWAFTIALDIHKSYWLCGIVLFAGLSYVNYRLARIEDRIAERQEGSEE